MKKATSARTRKQHRLLTDEADLRVQVLVVDCVQRRAIQQDLQAATAEDAINMFLCFLKDIKCLNAIKCGARRTRCAKCVQTRLFDKGR